MSGVLYSAWTNEAPATFWTVIDGSVLPDLNLYDPEVTQRQVA
jgi:hypothetical protein